MVAPFGLAVSQVKRPEQCVNTHKNASRKNQILRVDVVKVMPRSTRFNGTTSVNSFDDSLVEAHDSPVINQPRQTCVLIAQTLKGVTRKIQKSTQPKIFVKWQIRTDLGTERIPGTNVFSPKLKALFQPPANRL